MKVVIPSSPPALRASFVLDNACRDIYDPCRLPPSRRIEGFRHLHLHGLPTRSTPPGAKRCRNSQGTSPKCAKLVPAAGGGTRTGDEKPSFVVYDAGRLSAVVSGLPSPRTPAPPPQGLLGPLRAHHNLYILHVPYNLWVVICQARTSSSKCLKVFMVEGKGFVGHVSNNRALLEHTLVQNAAERGTSRNQAQPGFWRSQSGGARGLKTLAP